MPEIKLPILVFIACSVSQRTREIGIPIALGAESRMIREMILREAAWLSGIGIAAGLLVAALATSFLRKLLFGVSPWDPTTLAVIATPLATTSLLQGQDRSDLHIDCKFADQICGDF